MTGLTGEVIGGKVTLYGITGLAAAGNRLISVTDNGVGSAVSILATAPANNAFRGVAFTPYLPGDATLDGVVDGADYTLWADNYLQSGGFVQGDFNSDGVIDGADYTVWADNYLLNVNGPSPSLAISAVPEPATWSLLAVGAAVLAAVRWRAKR